MHKIKLFKTDACELFLTNKTPVSIKVANNLKLQQLLQQQFLIVVIMATLINLGKWLCTSQKDSKEFSECNLKDL